MTATVRNTWILVGLLAAASTAVAQEVVGGLPSFHSINPVAESRSGLYFQPYRDPRPGWTVALAFDYASMVEVNDWWLPEPPYVLDAEAARLGITLNKALNQSDDLVVEAFLGSCYRGFMDPALNSVHHLFGISFPEREHRPINQFDYYIVLPTGTRITRRPADIYLGDLRLGVGHRWTRHWQTHLSLTLPTTTGPQGYGRGTISVSLLNTVRLGFGPRLSYEGSVGVGYTPRVGDLADYEQVGFLLGTSGLRFRFWGRNSLYANLYVHSPDYHDTGLAGLDRGEVSLDFGWLHRMKSGKQWRIGATEDPRPSGTAVDLILRFGLEL